MEKYSPAIHLTDKELENLYPHETKNYLRAYKRRDREKLEHRVADRGNYIEELEFHLKKLKGQQKWDLDEIRFIDTGQCMREGGREEHLEFHLKKLKEEV